MTSKRRRHRKPRSEQRPDAVPVDLPEVEAKPVLERAKVIGANQVLRGSNYTFLVALDASPGRYLRAIYKPRDGERPLHDYPRGTLYKREYAAFLVARALGWPDVPLTIIRDGPHGVGSFQLFIDADQTVTYFDLLPDRAQALQAFAVFDLLVNNGDRKGGDCLLGPDDRIWSIDHGLTFHPTFRVRTVMMEFWGEPIPRPLVDGLAALRPRLQKGGELAESLSGVLTEREVDALRGRLEAILSDPVHPMLDPYRNVPWPVV